MISVTLTVSKAAVYEEVAKTTAYTGAKMNDEEAYERIPTTEEDQLMLERFWSESKTMVCSSLKRVLSSERETDETYRIELGLSSAFDENLTESMERGLFSFFVMNITAKWYSFANKSESSAYATEAATCMEEIMRKAFYKKKPTRPMYN